MLEPAVQEKINTWLQGGFDDDTKAQINQLIAEGNEKELTDAFYRNLEFGTGGLRGIMGVGTNRMNIYTVGMATQGLANYLISQYPGQEISVVIAHDSRNNSPLFANITANVFSGNGIKVYMFSELRPTPQLSFAIRHLRAKSGVVLTASHNPKEYNGYKAYWNDGAQMIAPHDKNTIKEVEKITDISLVKMQGNPALIEKLGPEMDEAYLSMIESLSINKEAIKAQKDLKIVYSSLHGTGIKLVPQILQRFGFENVHIVEAQATPDGNFPTVIYPNPEEHEAMSMALALGKELDADLVMATDPDSDRVGIAARNHHGEFCLLNGNQTATLLFYYMLRAWKDAGKLDGKQFIVKTIVTTDILTTMAEDFGVKCYDCLTGFKYIAGVIRDNEGSSQFICGGEESYGYLVGDQVRDKDAISSCAMIAEMVAWAKNQGLSLFDLLIKIYKDYGFYREGLLSLTKKGKEGAEAIQEMMAKFRANPPEGILGEKVVRIADYKTGTIKDVASGQQEQLTIESSNVLQFFTESGTKVSARPSGTEPKIKFYFSVKEPLNDDKEFDLVDARLADKVKHIISDMNLN